MKAKLARVGRNDKAFASDWSPPLGASLDKALSRDARDRLDLSCAASHGTFGVDETGAFTASAEGKPSTAFVLELIARLQASATVPMIDTRAFARWLKNARSSRLRWNGSAARPPKQAS